MNIMEPSVYQQRSKRAVCYKGYSRESVEKSTKEVFFAQRCRSRSEIGGQAVVGGLKIGGGGVELLVKTGIWGFNHTLLPLNSLIL